MTERENFHSRVLEKRAGLFTGLVVVAILIGGLVEIVPIYTVAANQPANADLVAPYTPLELAGRDIYVREGCYNCHSQMVRPMRSETMRYCVSSPIDDCWSRAGEYAHDRPFQLGSRRIGPDLHRVGGRYPAGWHYEHMRDPRATSPGSIMPTYGWLYRRSVNVDGVAANMRALARAGTPYSDAAISSAADDFHSQADEIVRELAKIGIDEEPDRESIGMIAYLQRLGTDVEAVVTGQAPGAE